MRSAIVRAAAVTTWINIVRVPIDGYLDTRGSLLQAKAVLWKAA